MSSTLRISDSRRGLPLEFATEASAILARRSGGKSYTGAVIAEELYAAGLPFVILDPTGAHWGLRASADGRKAGLPIVILGGAKGDIPLEPNSGKTLANFVVDHPGAYVLDLSGFESNAAQDRFVTAFAERLYRAKAHSPSPLTLIVDEADSFVPQKPMPGQQTMLGAFEAIVRRGRIRGLGVVMISQRAAVINKNVLTQAGMLILLGMTGPQDREAADAWIKGNASEEERKQVMSSLPKLKVGQAWIWWPSLDWLEQVQIRQRRTFDSSATPKPGETVGPVAFAPVDLDDLKDEMAETIEKAQEQDPEVLLSRVADLERQLRQMKPAAPPEPEIRYVDVPVFDNDMVVRIEQALMPSLKVAEEIQARLTWARTVTEQNQVVLTRTLDPKLARPRPQRPAPEDGFGTDTETRGTRTAVRERPQRASNGDEPKLKKSERTVLSILAQFPDGRTHNQLAMLSGYRPTASTISVALSTLRQLGYVSPSGKPTITPEGMAAADIEPLPRGQALLDHWMGMIKKSARAVLEILIEEYPQEISHQELCDRTGYSPDASTISVAMSQLRTLELAEGWRASSTLMEAIR